MKEIYNLPKTNNICIMSNLSDYRRKIVDQIKEKGYQIDEISGWKKERDEKLFTYKIIVNVSYSEEYRIMETIRCNRCIYNKMIVISNKKEDQDLYSLKDYMIFEDYDKLADKVIEVFNNYEYYYKKLGLDTLDLNTLPIDTNINIESQNIMETKYNSKICCLYAYYEKDQKYKDNLQFFLNNGLLNEIDYYIIINGNCTVNIPDKNNIKVIKRENIGFDFGAYSCVVEKHLIKEYDYYIFMNTSVKGPYLKDNIKWYEPFIKLFTKDIKLVGTSINVCPLNDFAGNKLNEIYNHEAPFSHIQSMFFIIDSEYYKYLKSKNFFDEEKINKITNINDIIIHYEFGLSQLALKNGWNINCILDKYKNLDYRIIKNDINPTSHEGDPYYINGYFGKTIDPYDVIFFKNNRFT